ncbi:hypothetical protein Patl1_17001 [Pistacia atlantica]|uniref:Uncharacterized protein n=1 Tax=Pistacia atlantica TaxID=434234 RepID=A0ACC1BB98_9ROSI|nr:hypothetical protein Patl1_17001 [Pistacia atlantica]
MASQALVSFLFAFAIVITTVRCNSEGDVLSSWKATLVDPNNVLQSWDPTLVNPCTWFHVTCNSENSVKRVDLGNAGLHGPLVPQLGNLTNLQYLRLNNNNLSGILPAEVIRLITFGNLRVLNVANNSLAGTVHSTNSTGYAVTTIIQDPRAQKF